MVESHLRKKYGVTTENTSNDENFLDWDVRITGVTKTGLVTTYTIKPNNTYNNDKVCLEIGKLGVTQSIPSGIRLSKSDYIILTYYDDRRFYMIERQKLLDYIRLIKDPPVPFYISYDRHDYQLVLFDRPS